MQGLVQEARPQILRTKKTGRVIENGIIVRSGTIIGSHQQLQVAIKENQQNPKFSYVSRLNLGITSF